MIRIVMVISLLIAAAPSMVAANSSTVGSVVPGCKTYQQATKLLQDIYDEKIVGRGLMGRGDDVKVLLEI